MQAVALGRKSEELVSECMPGKLENMITENVLQPYSMLRMRRNSGQLVSTDARDRESSVRIERHRVSLGEEWGTT